jgi:hypothetical protein
MQIKLEVSKETASYVAEIMALINKLDADIVDEVDGVKKQIEQAIKDDEKIDDVDEMCNHLIDILAGHSEVRHDEISNYMIDHIEFRNLWQDLLRNVGEAMGPFCYAAFKLERFIAESKDDEVIGMLVMPKTVRDCVDFYEKNWRF